MYKYILNNILPADDLHWDELEKKYVSLSSEEIQEIIMTCMKQDIMDLKEIYKVVSWCGEIRVGNLLWKNLLLGTIKISGFSENGEPMFSANNQREEQDEN